MKTALILIGIIILLVGGFILVFNPFQEGAPETAPDTNAVNPVDDTFVDSEPIPQPAYQSLAQCDSLEGTEKSSCISTVAVQEKDGSLCDSLSEDLVQWCKKDVVVAEANENSCDSLPQPQRNQCHYDFGYNNDQPESCQKVLLTYMKDECLRLVVQHTLKLETCSLISDSDVKDDCILQVAVETNQPDLCNRIVDAETKSDCQISFVPYNLPSDTGG